MEKNKALNSKKTVNLFFSGVAILTIANVLVKAVGLISKIVLNRVVGPIGAGYYSSAYEIYAFLYVISTAGLPVAISIMVSKSRAKGRFKEAKKIFDIAIMLFLIMGTLFAALMIFFSRRIANFISAPDTSLCIVAVAPTILFVCLSSCMRGYFQGYQLMKPTAVSQFIEALCKVLIGVGCALYAKAKGYDDPTVAAYTILGVTLGVLLGMAYLYIKKLIFKDKKYNVDLGISEVKECKSTKQILKELALIAVPITISSCVLSLTTIIDTFTIQRRLIEFGMDSELIRVYYGDYTSLVISMYNLPTILFYPIANALVPLISTTLESRDFKQGERIRSFSLRVINMIALPCALGLGIFAYPILELLMFRPDSVNRASGWLSIAAISVFFLGLIAATNAFLNTAGKQRLPIISMLVGAIVKLISNYVLLGKFGIIGAPISTVLCYLSASTLNIFFTVKYVGKLPNLKKALLMPLLCGIISIGGSAVIYLLLSNVIPSRIVTVFSILLAVVSYVLFILKTKTVKKEEILLLPHGEMIVKILDKLKFFPKNVKNI